MVNQEELAFCRRRGHLLHGVRPGTGWSPCEFCGVWVREQIVREEREEEPPEEEQSADFQAHKRLMEMKQDIDRRKASGG